MINPEERFWRIRTENRAREREKLAPDSVCHRKGGSRVPIPSRRMKEPIHTLALSCLAIRLWTHSFDDQRRWIQEKTTRRVSCDIVINYGYLLFNSQIATWWETLNYRQVSLHVDSETEENRLLCSAKRKEKKEKTRPGNQNLSIWTDNVKLIIEVCSHTSDRCTRSFTSSVRWRVFFARRISFIRTVALTDC